MGQVPGVRRRAGGQTARLQLRPPRPVRDQQTVRMSPSKSSTLAAAAAALLCWGCSRQPAAAPGTAAAPFRITLQLDWVAEPEHGGIYQALARGFFSEAGLDVTVVQGGPNAFVMQKLATDR